MIPRALIISYARKDSSECTGFRTRESPAGRVSCRVIPEAFLTAPNIHFNVRELREWKIGWTQSLPPEEKHEEKCRIGKELAM